MHTNRARKLLVALLLLGGVTLVGLGIRPAPAQTAPQAAPLLQEAPASLEARAALPPTHPYTPTLQFLAAAGGEGGDILASGGYAYVGDGVQLSIFDVTNPAAPQRVARLGQRGSICQMELVDNRLYVAARFGGLRIYEVSDPAHPRLLGAASEGHTTCPFHVAGGMVYAFYRFKLQAIDISNPAAPDLRGAVDIYLDIINPGSIFSMGSTVYAGNSVINTSDPDQLQVTLAVTGTWVAVGDGLAVADGVECFKGSCWGGLFFYDLSDPAYPQLSGGYPLGAETEFVQVDGDLLVYSYHSQTSILDIAQPDAPVLLSTVPGKAFEKDGDWLYISSDTYVDPIAVSGFNVMDIGNPAQPELVGSHTNLNFIYGYARSGEMAFLRTVVPFRDYHELQIIDVTHPSNPYMVSNSYERDLFSVKETYVEEERAYVLADTPFFHALDYRNAAAPDILGSHKVSELGISYLSVVGDYAYMEGGGQLKIIDLHDPTQPTIVQTYGGNEGEPWWAAPLKILENQMGYVIVGISEEYRSNLQIMQFNPPEPPAIYALHVIPPNEYITALDGDAEHVFVARTSGAVELLDTSNPYSPTLTGFYSSTQDVRILRETGDLVLLGGDGKVSIVDFSNPLSPTLVSEISIPIQIHDIQVDDGWAYIAADDYWAEYWGDYATQGPGVWVYDIHDPYNPTLLGIHPSKARHIQIVDGLMYVSADGDGLQVVGLWQPSLFLPQVLMQSP
jgi:hypothetical protein